MAGYGQHPLTVRLFVDGCPVASEFTGVPLSARVLKVCGQPPAAYAGYGFALPVSVLDGFPHNLHVVLPDTRGEDLQGPVQAFRSAPVCGMVEQKGRFFGGSLWFDSYRSDKPELRVADADKKLVHTETLDVLPTLEALGYPARFKIACDDLPGGMLVFSCNDQELRGSPCARSQMLVGALSDVTDGHIRGWALDSADLRNPLELMLRVDGQNLGRFRPNVRRPDISTYLNLPEDGTGLAGFSLPAPPALCDGLPHWVEVVSAADGQTLKNGRQRMQLPTAGIEWDQWKPRQPTGWCEDVTVGGPISGQPEVSVVILNRNGATVLQSFLQSWAAHNHAIATEIIVVDHASTDASSTILRQWQELLDLHILPLDYNGSFSASCNLGACQARGKYLLFLNNDIVWLQDALPKLLESLQDPQVGVVGLKLLKAEREAPEQAPFAPEVQHLGVRFKLNGRGYWPFETSPSNENGVGEHVPQFVPAVTGAVLLCRKHDFELVGGFDPAYFYGFEDVELCLRLANRLKKAVVCRNDCVAMHRHGHTRLSGREMSVFDRVQRNALVLESQVGVWVKQAYWRSLVAGDGYITREPLRIGLVLDNSPQARDNTPLVNDMLELGRNIVAALPHARVVLLPPSRDWKNVRGLHVLVVGDGRYDIRSLQNARSDLLTLAWVNRAPGALLKLPWWQWFCSVVAPTKKAVRLSRAMGLRVHASSPTLPFGSALPSHNWRLRVVIDAKAGSEGEGRMLWNRIRAEGLPCWLLPADDLGMNTMLPMADICITVAKGRPTEMVASKEGGILQLQWRNDSATPSVATWLEKEMEACVGRTFRSS